MSSAFEHTLAAIDALHAQDPRPTTLADGTSHPQELIYAQRMSRWLERLQEAPSELLRIAVRAQLHESRAHMLHLLTNRMD